MPKYIVSQPGITRCIESRSSRSPTTTSAPRLRNACARASSFRTIARTALPCFKSSSVTVRPTAPTRPAALVTRMGLFIFPPPFIRTDHFGRFQDCLPAKCSGNRGAGELLSQQTGEEQQRATWPVTRHDVLGLPGGVIVYHDDT